MNSSELFHKSAFSGNMQEKKKEKMYQFLEIGVGVAMSLGVSFFLIGQAASVFQAHSDENAPNQSQLKYISQHPLVYDGGTVDNCKVNYLITAHESGHTFVRDDLMKSDCNGNVSLTALKEKIKDSRNHLLNDEKDITALKKLKPF